MYCVDMVQYFVVFGEGDFGIVGMQFDELWGDVGEIGCELVDYGVELGWVDLLVYLYYLIYGKFWVFQD